MKALRNSSLMNFVNKTAKAHVNLLCKTMDAAAEGEAPKSIRDKCLNPFLTAAYDRLGLLLHTKVMDSATGVSRLIVDAFLKCHN